MTLNIGMEQQVQVRGADGTILWTQGQEVEVAHIVKNTDTATITLGEGVTCDSTNTVIPRQETTAAGANPTSDLPMTLVKGALRIATATDFCFIGVALESIGVNKFGLVAGIGSWVTVQTTAAALARGTTVGGSATVAKAAVNTTPTQILGTVFKINTLASPGTGSTGFAGIYVNPR